MPVLRAIGLLLIVLFQPCLGRQHVRYRIYARLDRSDSILTGTEQINFWNNSQDTIRALCFFGLNKHQIKDISLAVKNFDQPIKLKRPLLPDDSINIMLKFTSFCKRSRDYMFSNWYPRLVLCQNELPTAPVQFADYEVELTVPEDMVVATTGTLINRNKELKWMKYPPDFRPWSRDSVKTLRFRARDVADFAWVASPDFVLTQVSAQGTVINILTRNRNRFMWFRLPEQASEIVGRFNKCFGKYPFDQLTVIDARGIVPSDTSFPGLVMTCQKPVPFTRLLESRLARQIAMQWFSCFVVPNQVHSWLSIGPAVYAEIRYMEKRHGQGNLLELPFKPGILSGFGDRFYYQALYYLAATNEALTPLDSLPPVYAGRGPILSETKYAQAGLFFLMLEKIIGPDKLKYALRLYLKKTHGKAPSPTDFIDACSHVTGEDLTGFFDQWLRTKGTCDYAVTEVKRKGKDIEISIRRKGEIIMPVDVELTFTDGETKRLDWKSRKRTGILKLTTPKVLKRLTLDPDRKLLEPDRWNNHWPRKVEIKPFIALPSFDAYQLFYGPYAWFDSYHGFQLGAWTQGREFLDAGPLHGRHMWTLSETYSTKIKDWHTGASYQTPLSFISDRLRISFLGDYSLMAAGVRLNLVQELGRAFQKPGGTIDLGYRLFDLKDTVGRNPRAWDSARTAEIRLKLSHSYETRYFNGGQNFYLGRGLPQLGGHSDYNYWKASVEQVHAVRLSRRLNIILRGFGGAIWGQIPNQSQFYLSGGLVPNSAEPVSWGYQGMSSGQEHWHYDADANLRGWAGQYLHRRFAYGLNIHLKILPFLLPFFDIGNVGDTIDSQFWDARMDAGVRLKLGWLYADFPLWRCHNGKSEFSPNWSLGLKLTGLAGF